MNYSFHPAAEAEFLESVGYYESKVPGLGAAFITEFESLAALIAESPKAWRVASMQSSRHPCRSTPCATIALGLLMGRLSWPEWMGSAGQRVGFCFVGWVEQGDTHAVG